MKNKKNKPQPDRPDDVSEEFLTTDDARLKLGLPVIKDKDPHGNVKTMFDHISDCRKPHPDVVEDDELFDKMYAHYCERTKERFRTLRDDMTMKEKLGHLKGKYKHFCPRCGFTTYGLDPFAFPMHCIDCKPGPLGPDDGLLGVFMHTEMLNEFPASKNRKCR